jgi:acyl-CoA thioesterase-2
MDVQTLLTPMNVGPGLWRTNYGDSNLNGRSYGGQLLGQAMAAALMDMPNDRNPTMMQFLFLRGASPEEVLDLTVQPLQDGKRFSSRHVRATQAGGFIFDAQITCATEFEAPEHADPTRAPAHENPEDLSTLDMVPDSTRRTISTLGGYSEEYKPSVDFRIPSVQDQLGSENAQPQFRYWVKLRQELDPHPHKQAAALAYLSDWWINFACLIPHVAESTRRKLYMALLKFEWVKFRSGE